jgi:hypothetical protein
MAGEGEREAREPRAPTVARAHHRAYAWRMHLSFGP